MDAAEKQIPEEIAVEETAEGVCYRFPVRNWPSRWVAWLLLAFGITLMAVACGMWVSMQGGSFWPLGFVMLAITGFLGGLGMAVCLWAQHTLNGRAEIVLQGEQLRSRETAGWARWTRKHRVSNLLRLLIVYELQHVSEAVIKTTQLENIAYRLVLEYESGKLRTLVKWYERDQFEAVARDITRRLGLSEPVAVQERDTADSEVPAEQPPRSMISLERTADGIAVVIPPLGILRSEDGRSVTKLVGGGAAGAVAGVSTMVMFTGFTPWWMWAMFSLPAFGGVLFVTAGLLGQRDTYIDVVGDTLLITTKGWRGVRQHQWSVNELKEITLGDSTIELNDEYLPQLQIVPKHGDTVSLLTGRRREEILWLAHTLRESLGMEEHEGMEA